MVAMTRVGVHEAKTTLSKLLRRVQAGEEIVIHRGSEPVARLVPIGDGGQRKLGIDQGRFEVPDDFDDPLPEEWSETFG